MRTHVKSVMVIMTIAAFCFASAAAEETTTAAETTAAATTAAATTAAATTTDATTPAATSASATNAAATTTPAPTANTTTPAPSANPGPAGTTPAPQAIMTPAEKKVAIRVVSKMTLEKELNETEKTATIQGYATAAGVPKENVELTKDARRQNKVTYSITVYVKDAAAAAAVKNKLSDPSAIKAALIAAGLPAGVANSASILPPVTFDAAAPSPVVFSKAAHRTSLPSTVLVVVLCVVTLVGSSLAVSK